MTVSLIILTAALCAALLWLLTLMPRMFRKPDMTPFTKVLYAHRGLFDNKTSYPENSMPAFRRAVEKGFGMEIDVQLTKDGIPVIFHDFTLARMCNGAAGRIRDYTYAELQQFRLAESSETIPLFSDFLALVNGRVPLIIEYKIEHTDNSVCPAADRLLASYKGLYCIESFNPAALIWYRRNRPEIVRGQLGDNYIKTGVKMNKLLLLVLQNLNTNIFTRPDFIAFNHLYCRHLPFRITCSLFGAVPAAWTLKSQEQLDKARQYYRIFIFDSFMPA